MYNLEFIQNAYLTNTSLFSLISLDDIYILTQSENAEIRYWVARALSLDNNISDACDILCFMVNDQDALVRLEVVDALSNQINAKAYQCLQLAVSDCDELVRAYAAYGIAYVGQHVDPFDAQYILHQMLKCEKCDRVRVGIVEALYILGETNYLSQLLHFFDSEDYWVRCSVIHALIDIASLSNYTVLASFLESINLEEEVAAVKSSVVQLQESLIDIYGML